MRARLKPFLTGIVFLVIAVGVFIGITRGGQDFRVFHYAGRLVLENRWDALYNEGPDRYLYAPGFALLIAPFAALPEDPALWAWLATTVLAFGFAMRALAKRVGGTPVLFAILFSVRPLLIDLRYGQVNLLILSAAVWALLAWVDRADTRASRRRIAVSWGVFAIAALAKIYPLALFLFPLASLFRKTERREWKAFFAAALGAAIGAMILLVPPLFVDGVYPAWLDALARKGLPTDTHNQSLPAMLVRVFGGEPFYAIGMGGIALRFPGIALSIAAARGIWIAFSAAVLAALGTIAFRREPDPHRRLLGASLGLALAFLPAHLIWKSYFVLGIPLLAALFGEAARDEAFRRKLAGPALFAGLFLAFTSRDFVGPRASAYLEGASPFLWIHLAAVATGFSRLFGRLRSSARTPRPT